MQLVSSRDMRAIEAAADAGGLSYARMMQNAGAAVARAADDWMDGNPGVIVVLCGPGNNGGDGLVAALRLAELGHAVRVLAYKRPAADPLRRAAAERPEIGVIDGSARDALAQLDAWLDGADLLVDALLGSGVSRPITGQLARILTLAAEAVMGPDGPAVIAVDLPSGLDPDSGAVDPLCLAADLTVTFGFAKIGHFGWPGAAFVGQLVVDDIGIAADLAERSETDLRVVTVESVAESLLEPPLDAHKGSFGRSLVWAGATRYPGAAALASEAAARAGCGLVQVALPGASIPGVATRVPEAIWLPLPEATALADDAACVASAARALQRAAAEAQAVVFGPGLSTEPGLAALLDALLTALAEQPPTPTRWVVDADGLNLLAGMPDWPGRLPARSVLTPHPGEMARLLGCGIDAVNADRVAVAREAAARWGHVVVLKGALTVVAQPEGGVAIVPFANPALATAGTGDVLAGTIVGLLAQGLPPEEAARSGAWIHGRAGEMAAEDLGIRGTLARDVLARLPEVLQGLEEGWEREPPGRFGFGRRPR